MTTAVFPHRAPLAIVLASFAILGTALASQYWGGLTPCELCLWQRWAYVAAIGAGAVAFSMPRGRPRAVVIGLGALAFLAGAGIAMFHVGVEQHWWRGLATCSAGGGVATSVEDLKAQILAAPLNRCDEVQFQLLGLSMAGWNVLASLALAAFSLWSMRAEWRAA
jgi:disulfide bond formation protein DsbB